ncbi:hypothetical protein [Paraflavitalea pollutisoli]|uniref:hypothetical protein n=1 Tax=Paraflavitalea pollutisoli TaxID=3034143 RepID=UPI0023EC319C|nr:hypothetical protein [Paraflavitalea sp. H1-2-19X]
MESIFYIRFNVKTAEGLHCYGRFDIGNERTVAEKIFRQLKGRHDVHENTILSVELMETIAGLPVNLQLLSCTLDELANNCRIISKEIFNQANLKIR